MRVGIVGVGFMGSTHAAAWAETEAEIAGFLHRTEAGARPLAEQYGAKVYADLDAMLADVEVADICTPTHLHHEMVLEAARARVGIVCEKPIARTIAQGQEMIAACEAAGVKLLLAHVVRFFPEYAQAKAAADRGEIGQPAVIRLARETFRPKKASNNWFVDFQKSGGMMLDLMIHDLDYARWVAGEVQTVYAKSITSSQPGAPVDHGLAILTHRSGAISHVAGSWAYPPPEFHTRFEIAGDKGLIEFDSDSTAPISLHLHQEGGGETPDVPLPSSPLSESPYTTQMKAVYNALAHDAPVPVSAGDGLAALQIALAAIESARTGVPVSLEPLPEVSA
jgi:predicted dehydrogenase